MDKTYNQIYYENNKERIKATVRRHRENPEYRKKQMEWNNKWRLKPENRKKILEIRKKSQRKINEGLKKAGFVTVEIRNKILKRDNGKCLSCKTTKGLTIDHIVPISKGGYTKEDNLQVLCRSCNTKKQQKTTCYRLIKI